MTDWSPHTGRKVLVIVNPVSGCGRRGSVVREVVEILRRRDFEVSVCDTSAGGDATAMAGDADDDTHTVMAVGGDGTVREVAAGLLNRSIPIVIVPAGTENLIAGHLGMGSAVGDVVQAVDSDRLRPCDVGVVNGRYFLIMAGIGFDAEVVARLTERRRGHISHWSYVGPIWSTFWSHTFPAIRVEIEDRVVFEGRGLVLVGVMPCYASGLNIVRDAVLDDGLLDVCVLPCASRGRLLAHAVRAGRGTHLEQRDTIYVRCKQLRVSSSASVLMQCDGDVAGELPAEFSVLERAALFRVTDRP